MQTFEVLGYRPNFEQIFEKNGFLLKQLLSTKIMFVQFLVKKDQFCKKKRIENKGVQNWQNRDRMTFC
jgi:hypothetical protein